MTDKCNTCKNYDLCDRVATLCEELTDSDEEWLKYPYYEPEEGLINVKKN